MLEVEWMDLCAVPVKGDKNFEKLRSKKILIIENFKIKRFRF